MQVVARASIKRQRVLVIAIWSPLILAKIQFLHWNKLPKWFLFQAWMLSVEKSRRQGNLNKEKEADGIISDAF